MHKCKNPKYCPICSVKIRKKVIDFFNKNPYMSVTTNDITEEFGISLRLAQKILLQLERKNILVKHYQYNKRLTRGKGVDTVYSKNIDYARLKFIL